MEYKPIGVPESRYDKTLIATRASWAVNLSLFILKSYLSIVSCSKAIIAALVDSIGN